MLSKGLPASLLPAALRRPSAGLPCRYVRRSLLDHEDAEVRGAAFVLATRTDVPADRLREGLFDRSAANRRAAAVALGLRGDASARRPLYDELARRPSTEVIEAITAVWDDDAIVHLGRCARRHPRLVGAVLDALREIASPRAHTVARHLETNTGRTTPDANDALPEAESGAYAGGAPNRHQYSGNIIGAPGGTRTPDTQVRSLVLYPTELRALVRRGGMRCRRVPKCTLDRAVLTHAHTGPAARSPLPLNPLSRHFGTSS